MKTLFLAGFAVTLLIFSWGDVSAQGPQKGRGMHRSYWNNECKTIHMLDLSRRQREAIGEIERRHKGPIIECRQNLMIKKLELRNQLRDGGISEASIRRKSHELEAAKGLLQEKMVDYQLDIRRMLRPEQLRRWCTMIGDPLSRRGWADDSWCR